MRFGLRIPSYAWPALSYESLSGLSEYARRVDNGPYEDIWVIDHLLATGEIYSVSWLDPLVTLAATAGVTKSVGLGTAVLVMPFHHPVMLAKQLSSLQYFSGGRVKMGIGTGWDPLEFAAVDVPISQRGGRTDEALELVRKLLSESNVSFDGRFWQLRDVTIYPRVPDLPSFWVAGGNLAFASGRTDPDLNEAVLTRILNADGWMAPVSSPADLKKLLEFVRGRMADGPRKEEFTFGATQFLHVVETSDNEAAWDEQLPVFRDVMHPTRPDEDLKDSYLTGSIDRIQSAVVEIIEAGVEYLVLTPVTDDLGQLELITRHIVEPFLGYR